ncbi:MAG: hypothetical protein IPJ74_05815 [Saprospiraceae bacterium]|nr:hypothetical protein [Saprospiraceae bacterium]
MKPIEDLKHELREKVPLGIDLALQALKASIPEDLPKYNDVILLESRYRELNANLLKGLMENEEAQVEFNKLRESILTFINDLREEDFVKDLAEKAQEKARIGKVLYRVPDQMQVQKEEKCIIRVAFDEIILMRDLEKESDDTIKDVRIAEVMGAEILDPNETPAFAIRTFSEKVQFVDESDFTEWLFYVKPLLEGTFPLLLKVSIVEIVDGKERKREVVLEETIEVISTKPEITAEEKLAVSGLELHVGQSDSSVTPSTPSSGAGRKISTTAAAGVLAAVVLAIIAIWTFYPQLNPKEDVDYVYGPKSGEDDWNKIKDSNDSNALINFRADYPESEYADLALNRLESLRFQVEAVSKGDSIYFEATSGNYPMQLAYLDAEGNVVQKQAIASAAELMNVKLTRSSASSIMKVVFTDANGVKREVLLPENEAVKDVTLDASNNSNTTDKSNKNNTTKKNEQQ